MWLLIAIPLTILLPAVIILAIKVVIARENRKTAKKYDDYYFVMRASRIVTYLCAVVGYMLNIVMVILGYIIAYYEPWALLFYVPVCLYFYIRLIRL